MALDVFDKDGLYVSPEDIPLLENYIRDSAINTLNRQSIDIDTKRASRIMLNVLEAGERFYWTPEMLSLSKDAAATYPTGAWRQDHLPLDPTKNGSIFWIYGVESPVESRNYGIALNAGLMFLTLPTSGFVLMAVGLTRKDGIAKVLVSPSHTIEYGAEAQDGEESLIQARLEFLKSPYVGLRQVGVPTRQQKRAAKRKGLEPPKALNVINLRKRERVSHTTTVEGEIDWSCQWAVSGHWRNQWFPKKEEHRPIWVAPYVKGPEGKPFRGSGKKLFKVVR